MTDLIVGIATVTVIHIATMVAIAGMAVMIDEYGDVDSTKIVEYIKVDGNVTDF